MKFLSSEKAVSEVMGYAIILGISITGIAMITLVGMPSIYKLQDMTVVKDVEQAFTLSSSKASSILIGEAPMRMAKINLGGGTVTVEPNGTSRESYMAIKSANNTFNITIPMGKVKYTYGDRIVGYEGGGVWSKYPSGGSVMVFPPEFNYDGRTLMLPVFNVNGNATVGGKGTATVVFKKKSTIVLFPNTTINKTWTDPLNYSNTGVVYVNITSDFYDAWAEYARSLSFTRVYTNKTNHTTSIEFTVVPSTLGANTTLTNIISLMGLPPDNTPMNNISFNIQDANFNNFNWQLTAKSGTTKTLIFDLKKGTDISVGYRDTTYNPNAEIWDKNGAFTVTGNHVNINLLDNNTLLTYTGVTVGTNTPCANKMNPSDLHDPDFSWDNIDISTTNENKTQSLYNITQHYIWLMSQPNGDVSLGGCTPAGKHGPQPGSTMIINYSAIGTITFLHVSNNTADVNII